MINLQTGLDYLKHILKAKTRHGVHSPFAYRLIDKVIYDFHAKKVYYEIEKLRADLMRDERLINLADPSADSQIDKNSNKQIRILAKKVLRSAPLAQLIYRLAADIAPRTIIELGTCLGITTAYLAKAAPEARIISIDTSPETAEIARENLDKLQIYNTEILAGDFTKLLPNIIDRIPELDFILINGNHTKEAILNYFQCCLPKLGEHSIMIIDDIHRGKGMNQAWAQIKAQPEVSVTIDLFHIGLVFVRKGQAKEDFKIRF